MKKLTVILLIVFLTGCDKDNERRKDLKVEDINLIDIGRGETAENKFEKNLVGDTLHCKIRTLYIKKNDTIAYINAFIEKNVLNISAVSSPYDFDCNADSCFTIHDLSFKVIGVNKNNYPINIWINHNFNIKSD